MRHFNLVKSLTKVNNITSLPFRKGLGLGRLILCLSLATIGVNDALGAYRTEVYVNSSPTTGGNVYIGTSSGCGEYSCSKSSDDAAQGKDGFATSGSFTWYFCHKTNANYVFKGWTTNQNANSGDGASSNPWTKSLEATWAWNSGSGGNSYTYYAIFARMTGSIGSGTPISFDKVLVGSESAQKTITLTHLRAGTITLTVPDGFSVSPATITSEPTVEHEETITITVVNKGAHSGKLTISSNNGLTELTYPLSATGLVRPEIVWVDGDEQTIEGGASLNPGDLLRATCLTSSIDKYTFDEKYFNQITDEDNITYLQVREDIIATGSIATNLTAHVPEAAEAYVAEGESTIGVNITNKTRLQIEWTDNISDLDNSEKFFPYTMPMHLTVKTKSGETITGKAIRYEVSPNTDYIDISGTTLTVKGAGGPTTIRAYVDEDDSYSAASTTKTVMVYNLGDVCDKEIGPYSCKLERGANDYQIPEQIKAAGTLTFNFSRKTAQKTLTITEYSATRTVLHETKYDYNETGDKTINLQTNTAYINFNAPITGLTGQHFQISNIKVTRRTSAKVTMDATDITGKTEEEWKLSNVRPFDVSTKSLTIDYSNRMVCAKFETGNQGWTVDKKVIGKCGEEGSGVLTLSFSSTTPGNYSDKLILFDSDGTYATINLSASVTKPAQILDTWNLQKNYKTTDKQTLFAKTTFNKTDFMFSVVSSNPTNIVDITNGTITFSGAGTAEIKAHIDGDDIYQELDETRTITISKVTPTIVTLPTVGDAITYGSKLSDVALAGGSAKDDKGNPVTGHFVWVTPDEIPHGGQQQYTVRFVPDNTNMYTSDAVSTETLTITVNKADQTITWDVESPIKIKKEDGDYIMTASSTSGRAITYTISKLELATIDGNKLTPLKSGDCTITAVCPADGDYNESNSIEKQLFIAGPDEIIWKYKDGDHVWAGQNLNADGKLATAHTPVWFGKDETQWYLTVVNETNPKTVYSESASDGTLVTISASTSGDGYYASISSSIQVYIDRCYQGLVWDQNFLSYLADEQGHIDQTEDLTAYAVDSLNRETNLPIVYSVDNTDVAEIVGDATNGWKLHIKGAGSATLTASVDQTNIYQGITETRKINVRKEGEHCGSYALISTSEKNMNEINENTYMFDVPGETLTFKTRKFMAITLNTEITVEGWNNSTNVWEKIGTYTLDNTGNETKTYTLGENVRKVKITPKTTFESDYRYVSDLYVTQKEYLRTSINEINERIYINEDFSKVITIDHSDKPYINCVVDNDQLEIVRSGKESDCGKAGTLILTLKNKNNWNTPREINATITLTTSVGDNIRIPVQIQVQLGGTYKFTNTSGDNDWNNLQNWDYGGTTPSSLPQMSNPVEIHQPVRISSNVEVYGLELRNDAQQGTNGSITIAPTGGLTVYNGGVSGIDGKLTIESSREHTGYFRVVPDVVKNWVATPTATMQYASKGSLDTGADKDATWQYFGIPVNSADFTVDYITWLYEWSEPNGWIDLKSAAQPVQLKPFQGYAITQYGQPIYDFTGSLNMGKTDLHLTCTTTENGMWGDNMFANSYPSPIDVKLFTEEDFEKLDHKTFYLYNSGSWNDWNTATQGGAWDHLTDGAGAPGTFTAIPALAATYLGTEQTLIAPMQGICIHTDNANGATVHLDYAKHVWDAMPAGSKDNMTAPLLAPARKGTSQKPEGVSDEVWEEVQYAQYRRDSIAEAHKQKVTELRHRVRLTVYGENSGADHIYLLEKDGFTADYDNGYDAYKMFNDGPLNLYTNEDFGQMAVSARNSIDSTYIGIEAGEDDVYQLIVSSVIGDSLLLFDTETSEIFALTDSAVYTFYAVPNQTNDFRFRIVDYGKRTHEQGHDTPTSWQDVNGTNVYVWYARHKLYIADAQKNSLAHIYTANGTLVSAIPFDYATSINVENLAAGVYIVRVNNTNHRFVTN